MERLETVSRSPLGRWRRLGSLVAVAALVAGGAAIATHKAGAATVDGVVIDVAVTPTNPFPGEQVRTNLTWCVPDGTQAGDTFNLTLSEYLQNLPSGFALADGDDGPVVANATISNTSPAVATFTMTDYVTTHLNVCGTAFIQSAASNALTGGVTVPFTFTAGDRTFTTDVTPRAYTGTGLDGSFKYGGWPTADQGHTVATDAVRWRIITPRGPATSSTITDNPPDGQNINCAKTQLEVGTKDPGGTISNPQPYTDPATTISCTQDSITVVTGAFPADHAVRMTIIVDLDAPTGPDSTTFDNTARVVTNLADGSVTTNNLKSNVVSSTAGGEGSGNLPLPAITIDKKDVDGNDADTIDTQATLPTGSTGLDFTITNTGAEALKDITVTDTVISNGTVTGLACVFPDQSIGTTWAGPLAGGASFPCTAQLDGVVTGSPSHEDNSTVTATGNFSGTPVTDENPYFATTPPVPGVDIVKFATDQGPVEGNFDTAPGNIVPVDTEIPVTMTIANTGEEALTDVVVTDSTREGPAMKDLTCVFPDGSGGTTWSGPFEVGDSFDCTGTVPAMPVGTQHTNDANVAGTGQITGIGVTASNPYNEKTPNPEPTIAIVKGDSNGNAGDDAASGPLLGFEPASTGLVFAVTNDGNEALVDVTVTDSLIANGDVTNLSCVFPDKSTGTTWSGPFAPGDSFDCTANLTNVLSGTDHQNLATVTGAGQFSGTPVDDDNPYFAHADKPVAPTNPDRPGVIVPIPIPVPIPVPGDTGKPTTPESPAGNQSPGAAQNGAQNPDENARAGGRIDSGDGAGLQGVDTTLLVLGGVALIGAAGTAGAIAIRNRRRSNTTA